VPKDILLALIAVMGPVLVAFIGVLPKFSKETRKTALVFSFGAIITVVIALFFNRIVLPSAVNAPVNTKVTLGEIQLKKAILYAKIEYFRDKSKNNIPVKTKLVGRKEGKGFLQEVDLYDEAEYLSYFEMQPHTVEKFVAETHSSGITDIKTFYPAIATYDLDTYEKTNGKSLKYTLDIKGKDFIVVSRKFYNGYQKNSKGEYESDAGIHIQWPTDELHVYFDLTSLDYKNVIKSKPRMWIKSSDGGKVQINATYDQGILKSGAILDIKKDAKIIWDWEWSTE